MIESFNTGPYTVTRYAAPTYTKGTATQGATTTFTIQATVQPLTPREALLLPEGERLRQNLKVYSATELKPSDNNGELPADTIEYRGENYKVISVERRDQTDIPHFKHIVQKIDANADARQ